MRSDLRGSALSKDQIAVPDVTLGETAEPNGCNRRPLAACVMDPLVVAIECAVGG